MLFGVEMTSLYTLLLVNCVLCFVCAYSATYGPESVFEGAITLETLGKYYDAI